LTLHDFLLIAFWFLVSAIWFVLIFKKLGLSSILGYMAAGVLIGPWGLKAVNDVHQVQSFAEFGVALLLFVIGLELQPRKLWTMKASVFGFGGLQVSVTSIVLITLFHLIGWSGPSAFICGFALSLSSTAFAMQILSEKNELKTDKGQLAFSVLLFQDLAVIPFLALMPLLSSSADFDWSKSLYPLGRATLVILGVILAGRLLLRPTLRMIAWTRAREIFTSAALLLVIGFALVMEMQGLSMALGSFLAGVLLAESEYRHEIETDIEPFKGLLLGLFFISVGMSVNFGIIREEYNPIIFGAIALMLVKASVIVGLGRLFKFSFHSSKDIGILLSQAGEFGFVIFAVAQQGKIITDRQSHVLVAIVTFSMVMMPLLVIVNEKYIRPLFNVKPPEFDNIQDDSPQVIIAGFGRVGQMTGRILRGLWVPCTALELDPEQVEVVRKFGNKIYYGDASRLDLLEQAGAAKAEIFLLAVDDPASSINIARTVKEKFPHLKIVARARNRQHVFDLMDLGITHIYRETFASALEMGEVVLQEIGMPEAKIEQTLQKFREHDEKNIVAQHAIWDNETELIAFSKEASDQLEKTLAADV